MTSAQLRLAMIMALVLLALGEVSEASSNAITATSTTTTTSTRTVIVAATQTATSTTTTTSTTTESCFTEEVSWEPLDMNGTKPTKEIDELACQRRCLQTEGCFHFTYGRAGGLCHLQDILALRRETRTGFVSGPFQCWNFLEDHSLSRQSKDVFIPKQFHCMAIGVTFTPSMTVPSHMVGAQADMIMACQSLCSMSKGCAHFSLQVSSRLCQLSGRDATPLPGVPSSISGPPLCGAKAYVFMQKKFSSMQLGDTGSRFARALGVSMLVVGLFLGVVPMTRQLWKRSSIWRSGGSRMLEMRIEDQQGDAQAALQLLDEDIAEDGDIDME